MSPLSTYSLKRNVWNSKRYMLQSVIFRIFIFCNHVKMQLCISSTSSQKSLYNKHEKVNTALIDNDMTLAYSCINIIMHSY